jgi:hypothetical protein
MTFLPVFRPATTDKIQVHQMRENLNDCREILL